MHTFDEALPQVQRAHEHVRDDLRKADTKAQALLSVVAAVLAGVVALTTRSVSPVAMVALWAAAVPVFGAVLVLLSALRPRLSQFPTPGTWLDVVLIGGVAVRKYQRISRAVGLLFVGICVLAVALVLAVLT
ncbi:hypothetical protein ACIQUM_02520 [Amycolatopsis azurea]|uniref:hypothetical protein n=1 Tax=Amycolatopsis azurea TaxID=36819 RepID=UPI0038179FC4